MAVSRRTFVTSVAAGSALAAVSTHRARVRPDQPGRAPPARPATWSARSPSATRAGSPAPATAPRSAAGGTGAATGASRRRRATPRSCPGRTCATTRAATRPRTRTSATASRPRCSPRTTSRPSTRTSGGCSSTAATPRRCSASTRSATRAPTRDAMAAKVRTAAEAVRPQVLHHVRRHRLDQHAVRDQDRLDHARCRRTPRRRRTPGRTASRSSASGASASTTTAARSRPAPCLEVDQLVQGPGLLRDRRRADLLAAGHQRLPARLRRRLPRVPHDLAVDGRPHRHAGRPRLVLHQRQRRPTWPTATPTASTTSRA